MDDFDAFIFKGMVFVVGSVSTFVSALAFVIGAVGFAVFTGAFAVACFSGLLAGRLFRS